MTIEEALQDAYFRWEHLWKSGLLTQDEYDRGSDAISKGYEPVEWVCGAKIPLRTNRD